VGLLLLLNNPSCLFKQGRRAGASPATCREGFHDFSDILACARVVVVAQMLSCRSDADRLGPSRTLCLTLHTGSLRQALWTMHAARNGNRSSEASRIGFGLMMAVLGCGLVQVLNTIWAPLVEAVGGRMELAMLVMAGFVPACVYWAHSLLLAARSGWNRGSLDLKLQPVRVLPP
jgi:hypothetical protein